MAQSTLLDPALRRRILWALRSIARRESALDEDARRFTEPELRTWHEFAGERLHEGDLVSLLIENDAPLQPLALRPLAVPLDAQEGRTLVDEALRAEPALLRASRATFLEAAAVAFGRPPLDAARRSAFGDIRMQEQRILELPSTAARVAAMPAERGTPLETYVSYVVVDEDDRFLIGLTMLEFERRTQPTLLTLDALRAGKFPEGASFSRTATLGGEEEILALLPSERIGKVIAL